MNDARDKLLEALMHLEYAVSGNPHVNLQDRVWAALYLVQAVVNGRAPDNFEEVLTPARAHDAAMMVDDLINQAKRGGMLQ